MPSSHTIRNVTLWVGSILVCAQVQAQTVTDAASQCRAAGEMVLTTWHKLEVCRRHKRLDAATAKQAGDQFLQTYPKLQKEVATRSALSRHAKLVAESSPYDFRAPENAELLQSMCQTSVDFLREVGTNPDWGKELACWR
jgi:hypothetical protein